MVKAFALPPSSGNMAACWSGRRSREKEADGLKLASADAEAGVRAETGSDELPDEKNWKAAAVWVSRRGVAGSCLLYPW